jgi:DNA-directed RNA polymerase specialized sigma subunit
MASFTYDPHFIKFRKSLEILLASSTATSNTEKDKFTKKQKNLVESLVREEKRFRKLLINHSNGVKAYRKFIEYILEDRKNILAARPFFRERQTEFSKRISPAIKNRKEKELAKFNINFTFIDFILKCMPWPKNGLINKKANEIKAIREEIILQNLPLAISRATLFKKKTPENHLNFMDLNQISFEGLINAVDKFVLPYTTVYRSVIIGRISGDLIENYSETMMHFYPSDKRKIYRANKINKGNKIEEIQSFDTLADHVNIEGPKLDSPANGPELQGLLAAVTSLSMDAPLDDSETSTFSDKFEAPDSTRPDKRVEEMELRTELLQAYNTLSVFELKILKAKGLSL